MARERVPAKIGQKLSRMTLNQVTYFANVASNKDFNFLMEWMEEAYNIEKETIFLLDESDERRLATEKAFSRGKVAGLTELMYILRGASGELQRRLKDNG